MSGLVKVHLKLEPHQMHKLHSGHNVQLKHHQLGVTGHHHLMLHPHKASKFHRAHRNKKGVRLQLSEPEIMETIEGGGFGDFINKLKNAGKWVKSHIIDTSAYQSIAKPIVRKLVDTAVAAAKPTLGPLGGVAESAVNEIGSRTGAYGLAKKKHMTKTTSVAAPVEHDTMKDFYMESMMAPRPGGPAGFTALPQGSYGDGISSHYHYHHYYYPHLHHRSMSGKVHGAHGGSFRLA